MVPGAFWPLLISWNHFRERFLSKMSSVFVSSACWVDFHTGFVCRETSAINHCRDAWVVLQSLHWVKWDTFPCTSGKARTTAETKVGCATKVAIYSFVLHLSLWSNCNWKKQAFTHFLVTFLEWCTAWNLTVAFSQKHKPRMVEGLSHCTNVCVYEVRNISGVLSKIFIPRAQVAQIRKDISLQYIFLHQLEISVNAINS